MNESLQIVLLTSSLITGVVSIILSNQLVKKYKLPYLSSYFYYLIFLFIFGIYGIIGSRLIRVFLVNQGMEVQAVGSICSFVTYLGIPFLVLSWYMFLRLSHEMVGRSISGTFNLVFFFLLGIGFIALGLLQLKGDLLGDNPHDLIRSFQHIGFSAASLIVYAWSLIQLFLHSGKFLDRKDREMIRLFGLAYLLFAAGTILLLNFSYLGLFLDFAFIILLFAIHLIPLFFLSIHLDKNFVEPVARRNFEATLSGFVKKYEISKRESEVIELICKGKSNQEISDSLFISVQTVKDHIHRIYLKTGVRNRVQLTNLIRTAI